MTIPKVSQEARDRAADLGREVCILTTQEAHSVRRGGMDDHWLVQAFAKFETQIRNAILEEAAGEQWQPRIGEQVEVTEDVDDWRGWRELKLFVAGVGAHRLGLPGLEITVSEDWPRSSESSGLTDDFWINRPFKPDMLRPVSASSIRQLGERGRG